MLDRASTLPTSVLTSVTLCERMMGIKGQILVFMCLFEENTSGQGTIDIFLQLDSELNLSSGGP